LEAAIARGQGRSTTGAALESLTLEAIMPPSTAIVIDIETDSRKRALADLRSIITKRGGTVTPTSYLFNRRGLVVFEKDERDLGVDEVLEEAIEAGAEDVEVGEDGNILVWTEPSGITKAAEQLKEKHGLKVLNSEIIWDPNEDTLVPLESADGTKLLELATVLQDSADVQGVYANITQGNLDDDTWSELQDKLDM
jgi:transcriptional/translational regulatory protein YebC/TACO1